MEPLMPTGLPPRFPVARCPGGENAVRARDVRPELVRSHRDLPERFVLGFLDEEGFILEEDGWTAVWKGAMPDVQLRCRYFRAPNVYQVEQTVRGESAGWCRMPVRFGLDRAVQTVLGSGFQPVLDREAAGFLSERYHLRYVPWDDRMPGIAGVPDGAFRTLALPVHCALIENLTRFLADLARKGLRGFPFFAFAELTLCVIDCAEGGDGEPAVDPVELGLEVIGQTGILPADYLAKEKAEDGSEVWRMRAPAYAVFVSVPFAGLPALCAALAKGGFLPRAGAPGPAVPMTPFAYPGGMELSRKTVNFEDSAGAVRMTWVIPPPLPVEFVRQVQQDGNGEAGSEPGPSQAELVRKTSREILEGLGLEARPY